MKKLYLPLICSILISSAAVAAPTFQAGADFVVPYTYNPSNRLGSLAGGHVQAHFAPAVTADFALLFAVEDRGYVDKPTFLIPGLSLYLPTLIVQPYISANLPIVINDGTEVGVQGAGGVQFGIVPGLALRYSVDVAYYFDSKDYIVNWVHAGAAITF